MDTAIEITLNVPAVAELNLHQLRNLKQSYQTRGINQFDALVKVTRALGQPRHFHLRKEEYRIFTAVYDQGRKEVTAMWHERMGSWHGDDFGHGHFGLTEVLSVFVREVRPGQQRPAWEDVRAYHVCYLEKGEEAQAADQGKFIPGNWLEVLLNHKATAEHVLSTLQEGMDETERQALIRELLIGVTL